MEDIHHSGKVVSPRITVPFEEFVKQMLVEGKKFISFIEATRNMIEQATDQRVSPAIQQKYQIILNNMPEHGGSMLLDIEKKLGQ